MGDESRDIETEFSDRHEVLRTVCVWRDGACYRIEIIKRLGPPGTCAYAALLWTEEEHAGKRALVRDVTFPWVHHDTADSALESALDALTSIQRTIRL